MNYVTINDIDIQEYNLVTRNEGCLSVIRYYQLIASSKYKKI